MTLFFRALADVDVARAVAGAARRRVLRRGKRARTSSAAFAAWLARYAARVRSDARPAARAPRAR